MADLNSRQFDPNAKEPKGKRILVIAIIFAVMVAIGFWLSSLVDAPKKQERKITTIKLKEPPPPPPPPPPKEQPKEVKKQEPKKVQEAPKPKPQPEPPQEQLKMEGAAGDGPSPFAAGEVNSEYKGGDVGTKIGGVNKSKYSWYNNKLSNEIQDAIQNHEKLKFDQFELILKIWLKHNGKIERLDIVRSTGDADRDALIKSVLSNLNKVTAPPDDLGEPIFTLKIKGRPLMR